MSYTRLRAVLGLGLGCTIMLQALQEPATPAALAARAHHSTLPFDGEHPTTLRGVVTKYDWRNPHSYVHLDVKDEAGKIEHWTVETESLIFLRRLGWTKDMLKAGDVVTTTGARAKNGAHLMRCKVLGLPDGRELPCFPN